MRAVGTRRGNELSILDYRSDIDGLRALAVIPVVLFHAGSSLATGGYVGVDVFFVISGFLITGIIEREIKDERFSIVHFYERRARRILPALFTVIAASFIAAWFLMMPSSFKEFAESVVATAMFGSNVYFWQSTGYFSTEAEFRVLLHTWSLAVEEQFYLFWPLFLLLATRFPKRFLIGVVMSVFMISLAASIVGIYFYSGASFYLIHTRAWELMCGSMLALSVVPKWRNTLLREVSAIVGIMMILLPIVIYDATTPFPGIAALWPCLGTALVLHSEGKTQVGRLLSYKPIVFIGLISYSLYLWHWPILALLRIAFGTATLPAIASYAAVLFSIGLAALSWFFIERPFRRKGGISRSRIFIFSTSGIAASLALSLIVMRNDGVPSRLPTAVLAAAAGAEDVESDRRSCTGKLPQDGLCRIGVEGASTSVLLWGDSHAAALMSAVDVALKALGRTGYIAAHSACAPLLEVRREGDNWRDCVQFNNAVIEFIEANKMKVDTVILTGRWALNATGSRAEGEAGSEVRLIDISDGEATGNGHLFQKGLESTVKRLHHAGVHVVILGGVPEIGWDVPSTIATRLWLGLPTPNLPMLSDIQKRNGEADGAIIQIATTYGAIFVPVAPLLCRPECQVMDGNKPIYVDDDHLTAHGSRSVLGPKLIGTFWPLEGSGERND